MTTVLKVIVIVFLTAGNSWAVASYAKKYGMGCKSCHTFGSELNDLGLVFKKNGHTFGEKNAIEKSKQGTPSDNKMSESSSKSHDKPGPVIIGKTDDSTEVAEKPEPEQPLPETIVYRRKAVDGTLHFSDIPYVSPPDKKKPASGKAGKKIFWTGSRPLSAPVPKRLQKTVPKMDASKPKKTVLAKPASPGSSEKAQVEIKSEVLPSSFEACMEQILVTQPSPKTAEAAMDQFREAETICAAYEKRP